MAELWDKTSSKTYRSAIIRIINMAWLVNYIRQCFCKHDFLVEEGYVSSDGWSKSGNRIYMRCKKCGYHQKHWKFL